MKYLSSLLYMTLLSTVGAIADDTIEDSLLPDSLVSQESNLEVYEDSSPDLYQVVTKEKTVYVTLNPTTVYVTVTEAPEQIVETSLTDSTEFSSIQKVTSTISETVESQKSFSESTTADHLVSDTVVVIIKTETEVISTTKHVKPTLTWSEPLSTSLVYSNSSIELTSILPTSSTKSSTITTPITESSGNLDLLLGDRQKFVDLLTSSVPKTTSSVKTQSYYIQTTSVPIQLVPDETSVPVETIVTSETATRQTATSETATESEIQNNYSWGFNPYEKVGVTTSAINSFIQSSSSSKHNGISTIVQTISSGVQRNQTGLEHLLENFSPYTDLPTASYTMANSGLSLNAGVCMSFLAVVFGILV